MLMDFINLIKVEVIFLVFQLKQLKRNMRMIYYRPEKMNSMYVCMYVCMCVHWLVIRRIRAEGVGIKLISHGYDR
jgi:hypothetical protein